MKTARELLLFEPRGATEREWDEYCDSFGRLMNVDLKYHRFIEQVLKIKHGKSIEENLNEKSRVYKVAD